MNFIINPPASSIAFYVANYPIYWYGIILMCAISIGLIISYFLIKKEFNKEQADDFIDFSPYLLIVSIFGARLFYILGEFNYYKFNPKEIIMINHGGISIYGAILFGAIYLYFYLKKRGRDVFKYLDIIALVTPLSQAIGRWGNYFNQEAYGKPTDFLIKLNVESSHRIDLYKEYSYFHPTFLYESILNIILFFSLFLLYKNKKTPKGYIFFIYLIFYAVIRLFVESFRVDSIMSISNIPIAQIISIIIIAIASYFLLKLKQQK